jgi:ribosomal protein S18 acetylase RimI-like enzyme
MTSLTLRAATPQDLEVLVAFACAMARETEDRELDRTRVAAGIGALIADPAKGHCLVAVDAGGTVVGTLSWSREWSDWRNGFFWWIQSVYVRPEQRRDGVFRALYRELEALARRAPDVIGLRLYVEQENDRAMATYRALGMTETVYRVFETEFPTSG